MTTTATGDTATGTPLHALTYTGHDGRTLVRLVPEQLVAAEDLALASVGVTRREPGDRGTGQSSDRTVGVTTVRAVGFPAWPILTDPANARHALNLVGDLEWARRAAASRAGDVKERFDALAADLAKAAPHFVPTLLEELSRIFDLAGNQTYARQYFGKARETERSHNVPVDPARHRAMFTEFAAAGVVGAREMTAECTAALDRFTDPADALTHVLDIMTVLTAAGVGPYTGMARDVRKVAKAAGVSAAEADDRLLDAVLTTRGFTRATAGLLKALTTSLPRYLTDHPDAAASFAGRCPDAMDIGDFLTVLDTCGQLDRMRGTDGYAPWLFDMVVTAPEKFSSPVPEFHRETGTTAGTGFADCDASRLALHALHPALVDVLLAAGLTVPATDTRGRRPFVRMDRWYHEPYGDLAHIAADPVLGPTALGMRDSIRELGDHLDDLLAHPGTRRLLADRLTGLAATRRDLTGAVPTLAAAVPGVLDPLADPRVAALAPDAVADLFAFDPAEELAAAVRAGMFAEYTWSAFEDAHTRARARGMIQVSASYPDVAVVAGDHVEVIGPAGPVWSGTGPLDNAWVRAVHTVGESGVVVYTRSGTDEHYTWWFGEPAAVPTGHPDVDRLGEGVRIGDGRLLGDRVLHVGDDLPTAGRGDYTVVDLPGTDTVAALEVWTGAVTFVDRCSGEYRGTGMLRDLPDVAETLGIGIGGDLPLQWRMSSVTALPPGTGHTVVGHVAGRQVTLAYAGSPFARPECVLTPLGRVERRPDVAAFPAPFPVTSAVGRDAPGLLTLPGGGLLARSGQDAVDPATGAQLSRSVTGAGALHPLHDLPASLWYAVTPRAAGVSARMRGYTTTQAAGVLAQGSDPVAVRALLTDQLDAPADGSADDILATVADCATEVTATAAAFAARRARLTAADASPAGPTGPAETATGSTGSASPVAGPSDSADPVDPGTSASPAGPTGDRPLGADLTAAGARAFSPDDPAGGRDDLLAQATGLAAWLTAGADGFRPADTPGGWNALHRVACYLGREKLLVARLSAACATTDRTDPVTAAGFARELVDAGILANGWDLVTVAAPDDPVLRKQLFASGAGWFDLGVPVHLMRYSWYNGLPDAGTPVHLLVRRADRPGLTAEILGDSAGDGDGMDPAGLRAALGRITEQASGGHCVDADQVTLLAEQTGLPGPTARAVLGGVNSTPGGSPDLRFRDRALWTRYGLSRAEVDLAQNQATALDSRHGDGFLDRLTMGLVEGDSPAAGVAARWHRLVPDTPDLRLTDREWLTVSSLGGGHRDSPLAVLTGVLLQGRRELTAPGDLLAGLLTVIASVPLSDPRRPGFAGLLQWATDAATGYVTDPAHAGSLGTMDLGCPVDDPAFTDEITPDDQVVRVLTEGLLDDLVADLAVVHPDLPGEIHDPGNSVPDLVTEVASALSVGADAARYLLQVLALTEPTDANVRAWNGWRKKDITAAGDELGTAGVLVAATRAKAARGFFLPGGWLEGRSGIHAARPMEVWKAPLYLLWADVKVRPVVTGCPPHVPVASLFRTAWERYTSGDVPGYGELTTTRYRAGTRSQRR